jgi:hypothetical protein
MADELEVLSKDVSGIDHDPSVKAFIEKFADADPQEALEILAAMQRHLLGKSDLDDPVKKEKVMMLHAKAEDVKAAEDAWQSNPQKFIADIVDKNPPATGAEAEKLKAQAVKKYQDAIQTKNADITFRRMELDRVLKESPKETIDVVGHHEIVNGKMTLRPAVVKIMHRRFILPPGKNTVPRPIAQAYHNQMKLRNEQEERKKAMSASDGQGLEYSEFVRKQRELDSKFGKSEFSGGM